MIYSPQQLTPLYTSPMSKLIDKTTGISKKQIVKRLEVTNKSF